VPLSEHEQRVLEQIERALYADDPKFAATVRGIDPRTLHRRRYLRAAIGGVVGIFFGIPGIIVGPFVGATVGEVLTHGQLLKAGKVGLGTSLGLLAAAIAKIFLAVTMVAVFLFVWLAH